MNRIREWRHQRGWSQQQLAEGSGTTKAQINKLETGHRRLTVDWLTRLASALGVSPTDLLPPILSSSAKAAEVQSAPARPLGRMPPSAYVGRVPVRAARGGLAGEAGQMMFTDDPLDYVPSPPWLALAAEAYAIYVVGHSMVPRYRPQQLLFIDPAIKPKANCGVVVYQPDSVVLIKEFVRANAQIVRLREYQPQMREFELPQASIQALHVVVGSRED